MKEIPIFNYFDFRESRSGSLLLDERTYKLITEKLCEGRSFELSFGVTHKGEIVVASIEEAKPEVIMKKGGDDYFVIRGVGGGYVAKVQMKKYPLITTTNEMDDARLFSLGEAILWCKRTSLQNVKTEIIYSHST